MRYERSLAITDRLGILLDLIREGSHSTPALAEKLQVCDQTIYRDIQFLRRRGHKISARRLASSWVYELAEQPNSATSSSEGER